MGTPAAAVPSLERLLADGHEIAAVYTQPDRPSGRGNKLTAPPVKEFALANNLPVLQPLKIKTPDAIETFRGFNADLAVVVAYGRILPETYLTAFPNGAVNVHFSLLPKYRGAAPVNWAIVNGETKTGVTTMKMDVGLDTGDTLLIRETAIGADENSIELMGRLAFVGADALSETLAKFDELTGQKQDDSAATFAPLMKKEDGAIDFNLSARKIVNRVRGFQPFPTSFTKYQDKKLTIWKASEFKIQDSEFKIQDLIFKIAGEILEAKGDELFIVCGNQTVLKVEELQIEGKRRMTTRDFLNGVKLQIGEKLG